MNELSTIQQDQLTTAVRLGVASSGAAALNAAKIAACGDEGLVFVAPLLTALLPVMPSAPSDDASKAEKKIARAIRNAVKKHTATDPFAAANANRAKAFLSALKSAVRYRETCALKVWEQTLDELLNAAIAGAVAADADPSAACSAVVDAYEPHATLFSVELVTKKGKIVTQVIEPPTAEQIEKAAAAALKRAVERVEAAGGAVLAVEDFSELRNTAERAETLADELASAVALIAQLRAARVRTSQRIRSLRAARHPALVALVTKPAKRAPKQAKSA